MHTNTHFLFHINRVVLRRGLWACVPLCACVCVCMCAVVMLFFSPNVPLNSHQVAVLSWISEAREGGDDDDVFLTWSTKAFC